MTFMFSSVWPAGHYARKTQGMALDVMVKIQKALNLHRCTQRRLEDQKEEEDKVTLYSYVRMNKNTNSTTLMMMMSASAYTQNFKKPLPLLLEDGTPVSNPLPYGVKCVEWTLDHSDSSSASDDDSEDTLLLSVAADDQQPGLCLVSNGEEWSMFDVTSDLSVYPVAEQTGQHTQLASRMADAVRKGMPRFVEELVGCGEEKEGQHQRRSRMRTWIQEMVLVPLASLVHSKSSALSKVYGTSPLRIQGSMEDRQGHDIEDTLAHVKESLNQAETHADHKAFAYAQHLIKSPMRVLNAFSVQYQTALQTCPGSAFVEFMQRVVAELLSIQQTPDFFSMLHCLVAYGCPLDPDCVRFHLRKHAASIKTLSMRGRVLPEDVFNLNSSRLFQLRLNMYRLMGHTKRAQILQSWWRLYKRPLDMDLHLIVALDRSDLASAELLKEQGSSMEVDQGLARRQVVSLSKCRSGVKWRQV